MRNTGHKMNGIPIILISIVTVLILMGVVVIFLLWKIRSEGITKIPNYRGFFIFGICLLPVGILLSTSVNPGFIGFTGLGLAYMAIGLAKREKW